MAAISPPDVIVGQNWSIWSPARRHWLLGTVVRRNNGRAIIVLDARYDIVGPDNELEVDERSILNDSNLFRFVPSASSADISQDAVFPRPQEIIAGVDVVTPLNAIISEATMSEQEQMIELGITRVPIDEFHFGNYRYTNLRDAISQARRAAVASGGGADR